MEQKRVENQYPPAMQDMGAPDEMSPIQDLVNSENPLPMVEITKPVSYGEPTEIRESDSLVKLNQDVIE